MSTRTVNRQCNLCEARCGISVQVDGEQMSIEGDPDDVLSHGYLCPKATALADLHNDPDRLRTPLRRVGSRWAPIGWDDALDLAAAGLKDVVDRHGVDAFGIYFGNPTTHSNSLLYLEVLRRFLPTKNIYSASSVDQFPQYLTSWQMFGHQALWPVPDLERTDYLLILGANPVVSNGSLMTAPGMKQRLKDIRARGGSVVVVDPRRTETARVADDHISIRPGGDPYLLLAMLHVIFRDDLDHVRRLAGFTDRIEVLRSLVEPWSPQRAASHCGLEAEAIERLAHGFANAPSAVAYGRVGVCQQTTGTLTHWLINTLNLVTGNLDHPGGAMFPTPPIDFLGLLDLVLGKMTYASKRTRVRGLPELFGEFPVAALAEEIRTPGEGQIRAMLVLAGNPVLSSPQGDDLAAALSDLEFMVAIDHYVTETSKHADLILPPTSQLERSEYDAVFPALSVHNQARYSRRVFEPAADAKADWQILAGLSSRLGRTPLSRVAGSALRLLHPLGNPDRLLAPLIAIGPHGVLRKGLSKGLTLSRIKKAEHGIDLGPLRQRLPKILRSPNKRIDAAPEMFVEELGRLEERTVTLEDGELMLIGRRHLRSNNSWMHNSERLVKGRDRCTALIHPEDADHLGLSEGDHVRVTSRTSSIEVPVEISDEIRAGVVAIPHGWGHDDDEVGWNTARANSGQNVNRLTDSTLLDALSGNGALNNVPVRLEKVDVTAVDRRRVSTSA